MRRHIARFSSPRFSKVSDDDRSIGTGDAAISCRRHAHIMLPPRFTGRRHVAWRQTISTPERRAHGRLLILPSDTPARFHAPTSPMAPRWPINYSGVTPLEAMGESYDAMGGTRSHSVYSSTSSTRLGMSEGNTHLAGVAAAADRRSLVIIAPMSTYIEAISAASNSH